MVWPFKLSHLCMENGWLCNGSLPFSPQTISWIGYQVKDPIALMMCDHNESLWSKLHEGSFLPVAAVGYQSFPLFRPCLPTAFCFPSLVPTFFSDLFPPPFGPPVCFSTHAPTPYVSSELPSEPLNFPQPLCALDEVREASPTSLQEWLPMRTGLDHPLVQSHSLS